MDFDSFTIKYKEFTNQFDTILRQNAFDCEKLHQLARNFLETYKTSCMDKIPFGSIENSSFPEGSSTRIHEEDMSLLDVNNLKRDGEIIKENGMKIFSLVSEESRICADIYGRLSRATYLLTTLLKLRNNTDNTKERYEALQFARYAIRYNARDPNATKSLPLALGWYLENVGPGLEKARLGRLFYFGIVYNVALDPKIAISHHLMARYCYKVSQLSWIERTLASKLFDPSEIAYTLKDAEDAFRLAHSLDDKIAPTGLWMAKVAQAQKKPRDEIIKWIEFGLKAKSREPINEIERAELEEIKRKGKF